MPVLGVELSFVYVFGMTAQPSVLTFVNNGIVMVHREQLITVHEAWPSLWCMA